MLDIRFAALLWILLVAMRQQAESFSGSCRIFGNTKNSLQGSLIPIAPVPKAALPAAPPSQAATPHRRTGRCGHYQCCVPTW